MKEERRFSIWSKLAIVCYVCSGITSYMGYDKMYRYDSGERYPYESVNAYVGGDAYNFIINGTYATAFFVISAMFFIGAICLIMVHYLYKMNLRQMEKLEVRTVSETHISNKKLSTESESNDYWWTCNRCGKKNPKFVGTCSCGNSIYDD